MVSVMVRQGRRKAYILEGRRDAGEARDRAP
jgi:hypothetical protein